MQRPAVVGPFGIYWYFPLGFLSLRAQKQSGMDANEFAQCIEK